jgi:hypothetical protein
MKKLGAAAIFFRLASSGFAQPTPEQTVRDSSVSLLLPQADDEFWSPGDAWPLFSAPLTPYSQWTRRLFHNAPAVVAYDAAGNVFHLVEH